MQPTTSQTNKFQIILNTVINAECIRSTTVCREVITEHETHEEATAELAKHQHDDEFTYHTIGCPKWWRDEQTAARERELIESNKNANDPTHPDYVPF